MKHLRQELEGTLRHAVNICEPVLPEAPIVARRTRIEQAIKAYQPSVMFYGHYNAGKSTLINALLGEGGEEIAETSDRPCTDRVHEYQLGDYTVYDTPGIDAPVEHEAISRAQLEKAHVVVFVTSTDGSFDERATVEALSEIYESGRRLVVVLNNKSGADMESARLLGMQEQLLAHLERQTGEAAVRDAIDLVLVNAKTGVKGRKKRSAEDAKTRRIGERLYTLSGVEELGEVMLQALLEVKGDEVLRPAVLMLGEALKDSCQVLSAQLDGDGKASYFDALYAAMKRVEREFVATAGMGIRALRNTLVEELVAAVRAEVPLETFFQSYGESVEEVIANRVEASRLELEEFFAQMSYETREGGTQADGGQPVIDMNSPVSGIGRATGAAKMPGPGRAVNHRLIANKLSDFVQSKQGAEMIKEGLLGLRKLKVPGIKGRWSSTLGKWAGKIGMGVGVGIQVISVVYEVRQAHKAQHAYENQAREQTRDVQSVAKKTAMSAERQAIGQLPEMARDIFGELEASVVGERREARSSLDKGRAALTELEVLRDRLQGIELVM